MVEDLRSAVEDLSFEAVLDGKKELILGLSTSINLGAVLDDSPAKASTFLLVLSSATPVSLTTEDPRI